LKKSNIALKKKKGKKEEITLLCPYFTIGNIRVKNRITFARDHLVGFSLGLIALPREIESPFYHDLQLFSELKSRAINFDVKENSTSNYIFL